MKSARVTVCLAGVCAAIFCWGAPASGAEAFITDQTGDEVSVLDLGLKQIVGGFRFWASPPGSPWPAMDAPPMSRARKAKMSR